MSYNERKLEFSPEWKGPLKDRSCTDWPCLVIFVAFMVCWAGAGWYALAYGDIRALLAPKDSFGRKCGLDAEVADAPYLVFFDLTECLKSKGKCETPQVCREHCPSSNWYWKPWELQSEKYIRKNMICQTGIDVSNSSKVEMYNLVLANKCAKWFLDSTSVVGRCIPRKVPHDLLNFIMTENTLKEIQKFVKAIIWGEQVLDAAIATRVTIFGLIAGGAAVCLLYIFLLRWLAFPFVFLSLTLLCAFFSYLSFYFYKRYAKEDESTWLVLTIIFGIIAGLIVLIVLCLLKRIRLACRLMKEASNAVMSTLLSLLFPILPWLLHLAAIVYVIYIGLYLWTVETKEKWQIRLLIAIHIIGFVWLYCFITALGEMILAATFATWYWTFRKFDVPFFTVAVSAWRTIRYHLGTLAFGSLLITICRLVRYVLEFLKYSARRQGNGLYCAFACLQSLIKYLQRFLKFTNRNAYIVCAVYGKGLCSSASDALSLIVRNAIRVIVLNKIVSWLLWLGKIGVTVAMGTMTWWYYTSTKNEIEFWWVPVIFVVIGAYLVANVFFGVYEVAVDTIFLCFLEDCERNDGSREKPYYMSHQLRKMLHKDFK